MKKKLDYLKLSELLKIIEKNVYNCLK